MNYSQLNIHRCDPCDDQIEEEIGSQQETPQLNAVTKPTGKKPSVLQPTQHSPVFCIAESGGSPLRYPIEQVNEIEENIINPNDTTNGAQQMMADTCTSEFYQAPLQGGIPVRATVQTRRPFTPPFAQLLP